MGLAQDNSLPPACCESLLFPGAQNPADGMQCGTRHLGYVLAADGEIDLDSLVNFPAGLFGEAKKRMGDSAFDLLGRHFNHTRMSLLQSGTDGLQCIHSELRILGGQPFPRMRRPSQRDAVHDCRRCRRIVLQSDGLSHAEYFSRRNIANDDILAVRGGFFRTHMPVQQHEKGFGFLALFEHGGVLGIAECLPFAQKRVEIVRAKLGEQRQLCD